MRSEIKDSIAEHETLRAAWKQAEAVGGWHHGHEVHEWGGGVEMGKSENNTLSTNVRPIAASNNYHAKLAKYLFIFI